MTADDIRTRLDAIDAYCAAATEGPWWTNGLPYCLDGEADVTFTVNARTDLPAVVAALRDALAEVERLKPLAGEHGVWKAEALRRREEQHRLEAKVAHIEASGPDHDLHSCSTFVREFSDRLMETGHERDALAAENARLRAQVQAVEALCNDPRARYIDGMRWVGAVNVRTALATTEAGEES